MTGHTLFLSVFVLACTAFPSQLFRLTTAGSPGGGVASGVTRAGVRRWVAHAVELVPAVSLSVVAALAWAVAPATGVAAVPDGWWWLAVAVAVGALAPGGEIALGVVAAKAQGARVDRIALHSRAPAASAVAVVGAALVAAAEEVLFRGIGQHLLDVVLGWPAVLAIGLTAVLYGLNHLYFGWLTVGQKVFTGAVFGSLYVLAGLSVLVPVVAHVVQNVVVLTILPRWVERR